MKVGCLADVATVVFAHTYFLYAFLLVVFLFVEYWGQQAFLCVFLGMGVVILLNREIHQNQVALEYHNVESHFHAVVYLIIVCENELVAFMLGLKYFRIFYNDFVSNEE